jgi:hypothetical protein
VNQYITNKPSPQEVEKGDGRKKGEKKGDGSIYF